ncbi:hypothetical protein B0T13DRAFT_224765 [Neurospora crassa]|nr:hypothetical protein B0T13DRAFT_224765 [Neurospora crassa]
MCMWVLRGNATERGDDDDGGGSTGRLTTNQSVISSTTAGATSRIPEFLNLWELNERYLDRTFETTRIPQVRRRLNKRYHGFPGQNDRNYPPVSRIPQFTAGVGVVVRKDVRIDRDCDRIRPNHSKPHTAVLGARAAYGRGRVSEQQRGVELVMGDGLRKEPGSGQACVLGGKC